MTSDIIEREQAALFQTYRRLPLVVERAEGVRITTKDGSTYLDFLGGIAVNALGHSHPRIIQAVTEQIHRYMHVSNFFYQEPQVQLAERLLSFSGFDRVFFTNSGTESTEAAVKLARRFGSQSGRYDVVGFTGGFHGRTYAALSVMDKPLYKEGMGPFLPNTLVLPYNDVDALEARIDDSTCAVMVECIQGEGGISVAMDEFIQAICDLKQRYGFLIIVDEVQAGIGRTGDFFSYEKYGFRPDIVTIAKSMGGGLPLGAVLATESVASLWDKGMHGTTYGGNAVACVAGNVVLEELEQGLLQHVRDVGAYLHAQLTEVAAAAPAQIREIRGRGLMKGIVVEGEAAPYVTALRERFVITNVTAGNVIRLVPPYVITTADVDEFIVAFRDVLQSL